MTFQTLRFTVLVFCLVGGCERTRSAPATAVSPDGSKVAVPDASGELAVDIKDKAGVVLYRWETGASPHQRWDVRWKDDRTLELDSSDIGGYTLEQLPDNTWRESTPGGVFSPDGKLKVQTGWQSSETRKLHLVIGEVAGHRSYDIRGRFETNLVVADPDNCARWDGNSRVIVTTSDGEHSWVKQADGYWAREK